MELAINNQKCIDASGHLRLGSASGTMVTLWSDYCANCGCYLGPYKCDSPVAADAIQRHHA